MDIYGYMPQIALIITVSIALALFWRYLKVKRLAATDEGICMDSCKIELDVGTHIVTFEGTLYHFNKLLSPMNFYKFLKSLVKGDKATESELKEYKKFLEEHGHFYAMRQGTKKYGIISLHNPVEIAPFFKSEQGSARKIIHAVGTIGKSVEGLQCIVMEPINLKHYTLKPETYENLSSCGKLLTTLYEKIPLLAEIKALGEKHRILQTKVDKMATEIGKLKDEVEYWKHLARKKGAEEKEERRGLTLNIPALSKLLPFVFLFAIGYLVSPAIPVLEGWHPVFLGIGLVLGGFIVKQVMFKK